jgi:hypothetical protein
VSAEHSIEKPGLLSRISAGMTSFAGIATALATIMTSVTAILGVVVHHQSAQLQQAHAQVSQQAQQITKLRVQASSAASHHARQAAPSSPGPAASSSPLHYFSNMNPTVDNAVVQNGQQVIGATPYVNTITFGCNGADNGQPDEAYDVAGSGTFTAEVGIPDNMQGATDAIATITFSNESEQQIGKTVQVWLGHPVAVSMDVTGVTQLGITCDARDRRTNQDEDGNFDASLGNAGIS